jgi:hypothetical protein
MLRLRMESIVLVFLALDNSMLSVVRGGDALSGPWRYEMRSSLRNSSRIKNLCSLRALSLAQLVSKFRAVTRNLSRDSLARDFAADEQHLLQRSIHE